MTMTMTMTVGRLTILLLWMACAGELAVQSPTALAEDRPHLTRQSLVGTWKLLRIEFAGPAGLRADPFYQPDSSGLLIYAPSGWMSVQITAPGRRAWPVPIARPSADSLDDARLKAAAVDSYYAYFGTWEFDPDQSMVTHHVKSSLLPAETNADYVQSVSLENGHLIFTNRDNPGATVSVRRKVWERID